MLRFRDQVKYEIIIKHFFIKKHKLEILKEIKLRSNGKYFLSLIKTKDREAVRIYYVPERFNELPEEILQVKASKTIKELTKKFIMQKKTIEKYR